MSRKQNRTIRMKDLSVKQDVKGGSFSWSTPSNQSFSWGMNQAAPQTNSNNQGVLIGLLLPAVQK